MLLVLVVDQDLEQFRYAQFVHAGIVIAGFGFQCFVKTFWKSHGDDPGWLVAAAARYFPIP